MLAPLSYLAFSRSQKQPLKRAFVELLMAVLGPLGARGCNLLNRALSGLKGFYFDLIADSIK